MTAQEPKSVLTVVEAKDVPKDNFWEVGMW